MRCSIMTKTILRNQMIEKLKLMNQQEKRAIEKKITAQLFATAIWKNASTIGLTVSQSFEWDTHSIMERAWKEQKNIVVPKCNTKKKQLTFYKINSRNDLEYGYAEIMEPHSAITEIIDKDAIELLIVPGLIFDELGFRIGFGGGYYDRFLVDFDNITMALASKKQLVQKLPVDEYDIPVQYIVTEDGCKRV